MLPSVSDGCRKLASALHKTIVARFRPACFSPPFSVPYSSSHARLVLRAGADEGDRYVLPPYILA